MASRLFAYFAMCWQNGVGGESLLTQAVGKGYITEQEKSDIMALPLLD